MTDTWLQSLVKETWQELARNHEQSGIKGLSGVNEQDWCRRGTEDVSEFRRSPPGMYKLLGKR